MRRLRDGELLGVPGTSPPLATFALKFELPNRLGLTVLSGLCEFGLGLVSGGLRFGLPGPRSKLKLKIPDPLLPGGVFCSGVLMEVGEVGGATGHLVLFAGLSSWMPGLSCRKSGRIFFLLFLLWSSLYLRRGTSCSPNAHGASFAAWQIFPSHEGISCSLIVASTAVRSEESKEFLSIEPELLSECSSACCCCCCFKSGSSAATSAVNSTEESEISSQLSSCSCTCSCCFCFAGSVLTGS